MKLNNTTAKLARVYSSDEIVKVVVTLADLRLQKKRLAMTRAERKVCGIPSIGLTAAQVDAAIAALKGEGVKSVVARNEFCETNGKTYTTIAVRTAADQKVLVG